MIDFFEFSNEMLCIADSRGYFTRVNKAWTKNLGWSAAELTSRPYIDFVHPDDLEATKREARLLLGSSYETVRFENRYRCRDDSYRWLAWQAISSEVKGIVIASARDVTEQKLQAEALEEAEARFRTLATYAPIGIAQGDAEGSIYFVNSKWCELAGATAEESMGFGWTTFVHPDDLATILRTWQAALMAGEDMLAYEFRFVHRNADVRWASSSVSMLKNSDGRVIGQIASVEDITERKAAESALLTKESQLRGILDHASAIIYLKDLEGRYILANPRHRILFCRQGEDAIGKTDLEVFPEPIARAVRASDKEVLEKQEPLVFEEIAFHDGSPHTYRSVKFPVKDDTGKVIALGGISTDISDLKEAHESLKKQEQLLRNLIEVQESEKQFLCREFHDGVIQYAVGSLMSLEGYKNKHPATDAAAVIDMVIGNLRSGVEDGRRVIRGIRPAVLDDSNVEAAIRDLIDHFSTSDIMVTFDCDAEIGRLPDAVQTTIYRVVQEALNNARKHSGTDVIRIELRRSNDQLHLEVWDFGCGFDLKSASTSGFGLVGMTERVRLLGGECAILTEKDAGTTIKVRLPIPVPTEDSE